MQTTKAYRKECSVRGKGSAPGCVPKLLLGNPDSALVGSWREASQDCVDSLEGMVCLLVMLKNVWQAEMRGGNFKCSEDYRA